MRGARLARHPVLHRGEVDGEGARGERGGRHRPRRERGSGRKRGVVEATGRRVGEVVALGLARQQDRDPALPLPGVGVEKLDALSDLEDRRLERRRGREGGCGLEEGCDEGDGADALRGVTGDREDGEDLADDQAEHMFQPMTSTKSGGMGLGLSVTRTIVESHGGKLTVARSALGGAAFSFNLIREAVGEYT